MTDRREPVSVLPEALRRAVLDCTDTRADAPRQSVAEASFRDRLEARRAVRTQSTLAITSGIHYPTLDAGRNRPAPMRAAKPKRPVNAVAEPQMRVTPILMRAVSSMGGALPAITLSNGLTLGGGDGDDASGMGARMAKLSQIMFAGLAVLG
ncbi:MAG TPA: hypothetical protein DEB52_17545, partial [Hyphomonas sp.]|nr:hypothetical protein [Hyphomonas sp.]